MTHYHSMKVCPTSTLTDSLDHRIVTQRILKAREKTLAVLEEIKGQIREGMTEDEARKLAIEIFRTHGVTKHWHRPYIRFGQGTTLSFHDPIQAEYRLKEGDPYYIDLGPVWSDPELQLEYEGDYGDTFVLGNNPEAEKCATAARTLFLEAQSEWRKSQLTGEAIYQFLKKRTEELGYLLIENVDGHLISDFPHQKYSRERLAKLEAIPETSFWVLEVQIVDPTKRFGAFFEDLLNAAF